MRSRRMISRFLLLMFLALSLTLAPAMFAQQRSAVNTAAGSVQEDRQAVPTIRECPNYNEYLGGNATDNFAAPFEPVQLSPGLAAFYISNNVTSTSPTKPGKYDESVTDKWIGQSFFIKCCKVCRAELEIRVSSGAPQFSNDGLYIGKAPFSPSQNVLASGHIWDNTRPAWAGGTQSPKTMTIPLSPAALNNYILNACKADGCKVPIDVLVQDDTAVDYIKLKIWTY